jgi:hypothetical protein
MAQVDDGPVLSFPEVQPRVRDDGHAVVELVQDGELVGEIDFTKIMTGIFKGLGLLPKPKAPDLKSVP